MGIWEMLCLKAEVLVLEARRVIPVSWIENGFE
jgi:hypothetical protein